MSKRIRLILATLMATCLLNGNHVLAQVTANSLAELRSLGSTVNNLTVSLSATGGDPHPVTGIVTPGHYWINGDHIADPANTHPRFLVLGGTNNTYCLLYTSPSPRDATLSRMPSSA